MPIDRSRYPKNWAEIARRIKQTANWHCEECRKPCLLTGEDWLDFITRLGWSVGEALTHSGHPTRFFLTTAHLDQNPSNNARSNLRALCTVCHLRHDHPFRIYNRYCKREYLGQLNLFDLVAPALAGHGQDVTRIQLPVRDEMSWNVQRRCQCPE